MPDDIRADFAANLRRLRDEAGITQEELGARSGIQMADISRYESALRDPRITTVARIAGALGVPVGVLLEPAKR